LNVVQPNGGERWERGSSHDITWTSSGNIGNVKIELYCSGMYVSTIATDTLNDGLYEWTLASSLSPGPGYTIRVVNNSDARASDFSDGQFTILGPPQASTISILSPDAGAIWERGSSHLISWNWSGSNTSTVKIELYKGSALVLTISDNTSCDGSYEWSVPTSLEAGSDYKLRVTSLQDPTAFDESGSLSLTAPAATEGKPSNSNLAFAVSLVSLAVAAGSIAIAVRIARARKE
jgi:hypothetical protein